MKAIKEIQGKFPHILTVILHNMFYFLMTTGVILFLHNSSNIIDRLLHFTRIFPLACHPTL